MTLDEIEFCCFRWLAPRTHCRQRSKGINSLCISSPPLEHAPKEALSPIYRRSRGRADLLGLRCLNAGRKDGRSMQGWLGRHTAAFSPDAGGLWCLAGRLRRVEGAESGSAGTEPPAASAAYRRADTGRAATGSDQAHHYQRSTFHPGKLHHPEEWQAHHGRYSREACPRPAHQARSGRLH